MIWLWYDIKSYKTKKSPHQNLYAFHIFIKYIKKTATQNKVKRKKEKTKS